MLICLEVWEGKELQGGGFGSREVKGRSVEIETREGKELCACVSTSYEEGW